MLGLDVPNELLKISQF